MSRRVAAWERDRDRLAAAGRTVRAALAARYGQDFPPCRLRPDAASTDP
jgi:hypothetical protein